MDLLPFFQWCYSTAIGEGIRNSTWLFPVIEAFHLLGLGLTAGGGLVGGFCLFGGGVPKKIPPPLWSNTPPVASVTVRFLFSSRPPLSTFASHHVTHPLAFLY